jgi:hypothetical protein
MYEDGYSPFGGYQQDDDFEEIFYGADTGGIDNALGQDQVFGYVNEIINQAARKAHQSFNDGLNELRENQLFNEVLFYICVFTLKLSLYLALRKGLERGYTNL